MGRGYFECLCVCGVDLEGGSADSWSGRVPNVIGSVETKPPASSPVKKTTTVCVSVSKCVVGTGERAARRAVHTHGGRAAGQVWVPFGLAWSGPALKHWPAGDWRFQV